MSTNVNLQVEVDLRAVIELADGFGLAFVAFILSVYLVVNSRGEGRKTVGAVRTDNVGLHGAIPRIRDVDDGVGHGVVLRIENLAKEEAAYGFFFFVREGPGHGTEAHHNQARKSDSCNHGAGVIHAVVIVSRQHTNIVNG